MQGPSASKGTVKWRIRSWRQEKAGVLDRAEEKGDRLRAKQRDRDGDKVSARREIAYALVVAIRHPISRGTPVWTCVAPNVDPI